MPVYYRSLFSSIFLTLSVNQWSIRSWFLNLFCEFGLLPPNLYSVITLFLTKYAIKKYILSFAQGNKKKRFFFDALVVVCLCMCRSLDLRDSAIYIVQQTLIKWQETEPHWQTLSVPTAGIRFCLETDVMVIDTGVQPPARHPRYRFCRDIFQSNQRAVKSLLCKCSELQGPLTVLLSLVKMRVE